MKSHVLNRFFPLLLLAILNLFSTAAFSNSSAISNLDPRDYDYLQADQNTDALFFQEIWISSYSQLEPENFPDSPGFIPGGSLPEALLPGKSEKNPNSWAYLPDFRNLIEQQIFPFQFFW